MKNNRLLGVFALILAIGQILLVFLSWLINVIAPDFPIHSLLSSEGIRWFCSTFTENLSSPILVWMILFFMAYGAVTSSGVIKSDFINGNVPGSSADMPYLFRRRHAIRMVLAEIIIAVCIMLFLTVVPHATLLNATGHLYPSSFSQIIIPYIMFVVIVCSLTYGLVFGTIRSISDVYKILSVGLSGLDKLIPLYILAVQLYYSLRFVLAVE